MRIIIAGSRTFTNYYFLRDECKKIIENLLSKYKKEDIEIISGGAQGADRMGQSFAKEYKLKLTVMPAQWEEFGKSAGYRRNVEMAEYAKKDDECLLIAFWNKISKGTNHMINIAKEKGIPVEIIEIKDV